ncbi:MAG: hypothetical protein US93_C0008G0058 [Candidatus Falkowbacteria bacterium GW2011_GWD2_38_42]|uniref:Band 7 domain-containing protein n=1 Tax=Candidatus Falkowbacteria bacterium GW2011_GWE1_38_31 TaxID=1618638 RepID=A0A0G0JQS3_9BACT|nr:MAG: hypothetical protein US84_C0008G0059 [Candidatus Falkowbacteria bacterium GW2011_GWF1_38_22]KKQ65361.1 MAG: hypothetical protein US87_C0008G0057 [Candidatus Falkowbacteria bacterium GW2011_GWE2_38_254]KKQ69938.1 MAG: hypothetical protein US91_C0008G0058 [Candidatus Falkowbacteria bacterium GW2011_GWE1_38_31]KKQ72502.1 MAG: hypothetical protein US93_C0008G0058 [Candidatus Falkowbacteria bacterium GW2011_GWD2_38_42]
MKLISVIGLVIFVISFVYQIRKNIISQDGTETDLWFAFSFFVGIIFFSTNLIFLFYLSWSISIILSVALVIVIISITIFKGWTQVPGNQKWIVQLFGKYLDTWDSGLNILFPWLGYMDIPIGFFMGQQHIRLYMDETVKAGYGYGHVDFIDGSAPVESTVYFQIVDEKKAAYNITNLVAALEEKMDGAIRSYLGSYTIDEANTRKMHFSLGHIMNGEVIDDPKSKIDVDHRQAKLWKTIYEQWGVEVLDVVISDIVIPEDLKKIRNELMQAKKDAEKAVEAKKATITKAEGEKESLELLGQGFASQIEDLKKMGLSQYDAVNYLTNRIKWEKVGDKTVIIDNGSGISGLGSQFGAGLKSMINK